MPSPIPTSPHASHGGAADLGQAKASLATLADVANGECIPVAVALVNPQSDPAAVSYYSDWAVTLSATHMAFQASIYLVDRAGGLSLKPGHQISARSLPAVMRAAAEAAAAAARLNPGLKRLLAGAAEAQSAPGRPSPELRHLVRAALLVAAFLSDATQLLLASLPATDAGDIFLIASGGAVLMDSGLEAIRLAAGMGAGAPPNWQEPSRNALNGVGWLL